MSCDKNELVVFLGMMCVMLSCAFKRLRWTHQS